jgi:hypothetical protein
VSSFKVMVGSHQTFDQEAARLISFQPFVFRP